MELLREERESARRAMEQDILRLHRQLGTGIEPERIECLARVLTAHAAPVGNIHGLRFQERIEIEILRLLYLRAGEAAWERLETLLARTGLAWPLPAGPAANAPTEELQKQREAHTEEIRRFFLETPPRAAADLIRGSVEAWRYGYPARDSYLWLQTALRGVAAALRAEAFAVAAESWLWRSSELEKRILDCVADGLTDAGRILERGVHNAAEAAQVASQVDAVCDTVIPELVWRHAAKRLCAGPWLSWPATSTSSGEQVDLDLVCGMSVPAQAREQLVRNGHTFHFCSSYCRREFEQQPAKFIPLNQPLRSTVITNLTNAKRKEPL